MNQKQLMMQQLSNTVVFSIQIEYRGFESEQQSVKYGR